MKSILKEEVDSNLGSNAKTESNTRKAESAVKNEGSADLLDNIHDAVSRLRLPDVAHSPHKQVLAIIN
jgi:hypothetical protein